MTEAPLTYEGEVSFDNIPKHSVGITITLKETKGFKVRFWLMRVIAVIYFRIMAFLSSGVVDGVCEV